MTAGRLDSEEEATTYAFVHAAQAVFAVYHFVISA
jgi:hypothetical protein